MKMKCTKKFLSFILCMMLIVAMALCTVGCSGKTEEAPSTGNVEVASDVTVLGEGAKAFAFNVVDLEGNETKYEIHTDKEIVGDALQELGLIEGEEGAYGLYVKKVNGILADYDVDQTYWGFFVNDEYAMSGVDTTPIEEGKTYSFKVSK